MKNEILAAVNFITKLMSHSSFTLDQENLFRSSLLSLMESKFSSHWDPTDPLKGNAYRSILLTENYLDPIIVMSSKLAGIVEIDRKKLPSELVIWIDPNEVTYRLGDNGSIAYLIIGADTYENDQVASSTLLSPKLSRPSLLPLSSSVFMNTKTTSDVPRISVH